MKTYIVQGFFNTVSRCCHQRHLGFFPTVKGMITGGIGVDSVSSVPIVDLLPSINSCSAFRMTSGQVGNAARLAVPPAPVLKNNSHGSNLNLVPDQKHGSVSSTYTYLWGSNTGLVVPVWDFGAITLVVKFPFMYFLLLVPFVAIYTLLGGLRGGIKKLFVFFKTPLK